MKFKVGDKVKLTKDFIRTHYNYNTKEWWVAIVNKELIISDIDDDDSTLDVVGYPYIFMDEWLEKVNPILEIE